MSKLVIAIVAGLGGGVAIVVAFRRQRVQEATHDLETEAHKRDDVRILNERFISAAKLLGDKESPAIRMAGVHAIASLADDWADERQMCIDVLCAYLKLPYEPENAPHGEREVRFVILAAIKSRLTKSPDVSWHGCRFDFTTATFDGGEMRGMDLTDTTLDFSGATFRYSGLDLSGAEIKAGKLNFSEAKISGIVNLKGFSVSSGVVCFRGARVDSGQISLVGSRLEGPSELDFREIDLKSGEIDFSRLKLGLRALDGPDDDANDNPEVLFESAKLGGGTVKFERSEIYEIRKAEGNSDERKPSFSQSREESIRNLPTISFRYATFIGSTVSFRSFSMPTGLLSFRGTEVRAGLIEFPDLFLCGGKIDFGGTVIADSGAVSFKYAVLADSRESPRDKELQVPQWLQKVAAMGPEDRSHYAFRYIHAPTGILSFWDARIEGGELDFEDAEYRSGVIHFVGTRFLGGETRLGWVNGNVVINLWLSHGVNGDFWSMGQGSYAMVLVHRPYRSRSFVFPSGIVSYEISSQD